MDERYRDRLVGNLAQARALIDAPERWLQGNLRAELPDGSACYCAVGAVCRAVNGFVPGAVPTTARERERLGISAEMAILEDAARTVDPEMDIDILADYGALVALNDGTLPGEAREAAHGRVLLAFDLAIKKARALV